MPEPAKPAAIGYWPQLRLARIEIGFNRPPHSVEGLLVSLERRSRMAFPLRKRLRFPLRWRQN